MARYKITARIYSVDDDAEKPVVKKREVIDTDRNETYREAKDEKDIKEIYESFWNNATRVSKKREIISVKDVRRL